MELPLRILKSAILQRNMPPLGISGREAELGL